MQYAIRHADPRTTLRYDMAKANPTGTPRTLSRHTRRHEHRLTTPSAHDQRAEPASWPLCFGINIRFLLKVPLHSVLHPAMTYG